MTAVTFASFTTEIPHGPDSPTQSATAQRSCCDGNDAIDRNHPTMGRSCNCNCDCDAEDRHSSGSWYSRSDMKRFREDAIEDCCDDCSDSGVCKLCDGGNEQHIRRTCRRNLIQSLLAQQEQSILLGIPNDPKGLAKLSKACSKFSQQRARASAIALAKEMGYAVAKPGKHCSAGVSPRRLGMTKAPKRRSIVAPLA